MPYCLPTDSADEAIFLWRMRDWEIIWRAWRDLNSRHSEPESDFIPLLFLVFFLFSFILKDFLMFRFVHFSCVLFSCCNEIATGNWTKILGSGYVYGRGGGNFMNTAFSLSFFLRLFRNSISNDCFRSEFSSRKSGVKKAVTMIVLLSFAGITGTCVSPSMTESILERYFR